MDETYFTTRRLRDARKCLEDMVADAKRDQRVLLGECHVCFYWGGARISGQAFTAYTCDLCGAEHNHPNTSVPKLCDRCAKSTGLCRRCKANLSEVEHEVLNPTTTKPKRAAKPKSAKTPRKSPAMVLQQVCDDFNAKHQIGTKVQYWRGAREGDGELGHTRTEAHVLSGHTPVVWVSGCAGCVALSHVEPVVESGGAA